MQNKDYINRMNQIYRDQAQQIYGEKGGDYVDLDFGRGRKVKSTRGRIKKRKSIKRVGRGGARNSLSAYQHVLNKVRRAHPNMAFRTAQAKASKIYQKMHGAGISRGGAGPKKKISELLRAYDTQAAKSRPIRKTVKQSAGIKKLFAAIRKKEQAQLAKSSMSKFLRAIKARAAAAPKRKTPAQLLRSYDVTEALRKHAYGKPKLEYDLNLINFRPRANRGPSLLKQLSMMEKMSKSNANLSKMSKSNANLSKMSKSNASLSKYIGRREAAREKAYLREVEKMSKSNASLSKYVGRREAAEAREKALRARKILSELGYRKFK